MHPLNEAAPPILGFTVIPEGMPPINKLVPGRNVESLPRLGILVPFIRTSARLPNRFKSR